jgi:hypothetical protein
MFRRIAPTNREARKRPPKRCATSRIGRAISPNTPIARPTRETRPHAPLAAARAGHSRRARRHRLRQRAAIHQSVAWHGWRSLSVRIAARPLFTGMASVTDFHQNLLSSGGGLGGFGAGAGLAFSGSLGMDCSASAVPGVSSKYRFNAATMLS